MQDSAEDGPTDSLSPRQQQFAVDDAILLHAGELVKLMGDVRSELLHCEVRCTYRHTGSR